VLTEMLPDIEQLWMRGDDGRYVSEQTVEVTGIRRPPGADDLSSAGTEAP
jgi:hypothetical protein